MYYAVNGDALGYDPSRVHVFLTPFARDHYVEWTLGAYAITSKAARNLMCLFLSDDCDLKLSNLKRMPIDDLAALYLDYTRSGKEN